MNSTSLTLLNIKSCSFRSNRALYGGALYLYNFDSRSVLDYNNVLFNSVPYYGGAIYIQNSLDQVIFMEFSLQFLLINEQGRLVLSNTRFQSNAMKGHSIYVQNAATTVSQCTFFGHATTNAVFYLTGGDVDFLSVNFADFSGAAASVNFLYLHIYRSNFQCFSNSRKNARRR